MRTRTFAYTAQNQNNADSPGGNRQVGVQSRKAMEQQKAVDCMHTNRSTIKSI